jgi:hypothetical protein
MSLWRSALADEGRGSERDDPRDECPHTEIQQDFIQNFGHRNPPVAAPLRRSSRAPQYLGQKVTMSCNNRHRLEKVWPNGRRACPTTWCRLLHAIRVSVDYIRGAKLADPRMERLVRHYPLGSLVLRDYCHEAPEVRSGPPITSAARP